jgi:hypothetical protein
MALAALLALTILASGPSEAPATVTIDRADDQGIPPGAPTDDYRFVAWCFGAMDESISVYEHVIPDLQAIDARIGSPVKEKVPYAEDVAEERQALKRFAAAMEAAERASPRPIAPDGVKAIQLGRSIWNQAKQQPSRQLAHAWLMWGSPDRCEKTAKTLKVKATLLGQAMAIGAPTVDAPPPPPETAPTPAPTPTSDQTDAANAPPKTPPSIDSVLATAPPTPDQPPEPKP